MSTFDPVEELRQHRPVLLACEAIGWLHMAGKAHREFLRAHGGEKLSYDYHKWHDAEQPPFPWDDLLGWVKAFPRSRFSEGDWPSSIKEFTEKHSEQDSGILGLLQAGHGIASGIEKNLPSATSEYLSQRLPNLWLSSPFGYPKRNLSVDPPEVLSEWGWQRLVIEMRRVLEELKTLSSQGVADVACWRQWRDNAIGPGSYIREAMRSTLAETRLPNNDVTLWDQSYVTAALFKSAVAGVVLSDPMPMSDKRIKQKTRWRLLTVAIGTNYYEARAVKIGDWTGTQAVLDDFFAQVAQLVELDLAVGALLYRDSSVAIFSFPGKWADESVPTSQLDQWQPYLQQEVDRIAKSLHLETPPLVRLSSPTRSLVPMTQEREQALKVLAIPVHRSWNIDQRAPEESRGRGHVCPVCQVQLNGEPTNKAKPCKVCRERRHHRLVDWLYGRLNYDTIWFEEVADRNNRLALLTFSLDLEPWLKGERVDSLRAQAIPEWVKYNATLKSTPNPITQSEPWDNLQNYIKSKLSNWNTSDPVLTNLQEGFKYHSSWNEFFERLVEDRSHAPKWASLNTDERAAWLTHLLFCKLPSPGRVYRFWREAQEFFEVLLQEFRQIAARSDNPWRVRRLLLMPDQRSASQEWEDSMLYDGRLRGMPFSLVYVRALGGFVTATNLARLLRPEETHSTLKEEKIQIEEEETLKKLGELQIAEVRGLSAPYPHLGVYYPLIPLELSPLRFRVVVPLEAASECVSLALRRGKELFARVWDRLPLRVGVVAFTRALAFPAVLEATRHLEKALASQPEETWTVLRKEESEGVLALGLRRKDGQMAIRLMPLRLPDGRAEVFYSYFRIEGKQLRFPKDFRHPKGDLYRHAADLRIGEGLFVAPARVGFLSMDSTATRFEKGELLYAEDWEKIRALWQLLRQGIRRPTALQRLRSALAQLEREWKPELDAPSPELWKATVRALLVEHLEGQGTTLETLLEAALQGLLQLTLDIYLTTLKEPL